MKKLNIAKLLKDCPTGMELDSAIVNELYFDEITEDNMIKCYTKHSNEFTSICNFIYFYFDGSYLDNTKAKCVIFPKGKTTWVGFQRPFKAIKDDGYRNWADKMIEGLAEEEMSLDKAGQMTDFEYEGLAYTLPDGYIFKDENGNEILTSKIILEKKKKEYPKTYEECCEILGIDSYFEPEIRNVTSEECHKFTKLIRLKRCRDAYWKIAGEEMGLGKPWEPTTETVYCISRNDNIIKCSYRGGKSNILEFPTSEIRDAFKENFDPDIAICKELL